MGAGEGLSTGFKGIFILFSPSIFLLLSHLKQPKIFDDFRSAWNSGRASLSGGFGDCVSIYAV